MTRSRRGERVLATSAEFRFFLSEVWREPRDLRDPPATIVERRDRRAVETVRFAFDRVPWYGRAMRTRGLDPRDFESADDLARFPVIEPDDLRVPEDFLPRGAVLSDLLALSTSGSTGEPRTVHHDLEGMLTSLAVALRSRAVRDRHLGPAGPRRSLSLAFAGNSSKVRMRIRETVPAARALFADEERIEAFEDPVRLAKEVRKLRPDHLGGYASALGGLFRHVKEADVDFPLPRVVTHGFDTLSPGERRLIEDGFGIPALGNYGSTEAFSIAFECGEGEGYHVNEDASHVRIADAAGVTLPPGEPGIVILSNLVNRGTVLLNYRMGDLAAWIPGPCPCGRTLPRLRLLGGRDNDWIERPDGTRFHSFRLANTLTRPDVSRWQIAQPDATRVVVRVLPHGAVDRSELASDLERAVQADAGRGMEVEIEFPDALAATSGGKVLSFVRR
jgi:phenylacetate-CoA ligase